MAGVSDILRKWSDGVREIHTQAQKQTAALEDDHERIAGFARDQIKDAEGTLTIGKEVDDRLRKLIEIAEKDIAATKEVTEAPKREAKRLRHPPMSSAEKAIYDTGTFIGNGRVTKS